MGLLKSLTRLVERRLSGGTMEDYQALEQMTGREFELAHEDLELERRLPRSALGEALASWSVVPGGASSFSDSTRFREVSNRKLYRRNLDALGVGWDALSIAATCRVDPRDPLATIQATQYRGATEAALRGLFVGRDPGLLSIAGLDLRPAEDLRVRPLPSLEVEEPGWRVVRGDVLFEIAMGDQDLGGQEGEPPAWLADVVDQIATGPRFPQPRFEVDLPAGWTGRALADPRFSDLEEVRRSRPGSGPDGLDALMFEPGTTYFALDGSSLDVPFLPRLTVWERRTPEQTFDEEVEQWEASWSSESTDAQVQRLTLPAGDGARLTFGFEPRPKLAGWGQSYIVRAGERSFRFDFGTPWGQRVIDGATFDAVMRSVRIVSGTGRTPLA